MLATEVKVTLSGRVRRHVCRILPLALLKLWQAEVMGKKGSDLAKLQELVLED